MDQLPAELIMKIFLHLSPEDITRHKGLCKRIPAILENNKKLIPQQKPVVSIEFSNYSVKICHKKNIRITHDTENMEFLSKSVGYADVFSAPFKKIFVPSTAKFRSGNLLLPNSGNQYSSVPFEPFRRNPEPERFVPSHSLRAEENFRQFFLWLLPKVDIDRFVFKERIPSAEYAFQKIYPSSCCCIRQLQLPNYFIRRKEENRAFWNAFSCESTEVHLGGAREEVCTLLQDLNEMSVRFRKISVELVSVEDFIEFFSEMVKMFSEEGLEKFAVQLTFRLIDRDYNTDDNNFHRFFEYYGVEFDETLNDNRLFQLIRTREKVPIIRRLDRKVLMLEIETKENDYKVITMCQQ